MWCIITSSLHTHLWHPLQYILTNNGPRKVPWEEYEPGESGDIHNLNTHQLVSPGLCPPHLCNPPGDLAILMECGPRHSLTFWATQLPYTPSTLHLSITGVWNNRKEEGKWERKNFYQSSPEALIWSFVLRSDDWREFFRNTISLWKIENIEKQ